MTFVNHFIKQANRGFDKNVRYVDDSARELLLNYPWPGNIRELQNIIKRIVLLSKSNLVTPDLLPNEIRLYSNPKSNDAPEGNENNNNGIATGDATNLKSAMLTTEKEVIQNALAKTGNNKSRAARLLNIDRKTLYYKLDQYDIKR